MTARLRLALLVAAAACLLVKGAPVVQAAVPDGGSASAAKPCKVAKKKQGKQAKKCVTAKKNKKKNPLPRPLPTPQPPPIDDCEALGRGFLPLAYLPCE